MQDLAALYARLNRVSEAEELYLRCQAGLEAVYGVGHDLYQNVKLALESLKGDSSVKSN
jgi:hypothetical protein